ncbi:MAG: hypothetical protein V8R14_06840 [Clostridia bacterium]
MRWTASDRTSVSGAISFGSVLNNDIGLDTGTLPGSEDPGDDNS